MLKRLKIHFARGLPERAVCGADIRRGGFTGNEERITCRRCQRKREITRPSGTTVVSRTWRNASRADVIEASRASQKDPANY